MSYQWELLTTRELAAQLKRAPETLIRWRRLRIGPSFRIVQGRVLYTRADVTAWLEAVSAAPDRAVRRGVTK